MSFEETALRFWQLCHHSRVYVYFVVSLSTNSLFWPLRLGCLSSSMQSHSCSRLGYVQPVEGANCDGLGNGLRQHLTKNRNILRKMRYDSRLKCSTLMQAGATVLDFLCKTSYTTLAVPKGDGHQIQIASHHTRKGTKRPNPSRDSWFCKRPN